jgi:hypothetical protein
MKRPGGKIIPFPRGGVKPTPVKPQAIVTWPEGLSGSAVVYPLGESDLEVEEIRKRLGEMLRDEQVD